LGLFQSDGEAWVLFWDLVVAVLLCLGLLFLAGIITWFGVAAGREGIFPAAYVTGLNQHHISEAGGSFTGRA
jgi:hypothetical protein